MENGNRQGSVVGEFVAAEGLSDTGCVVDQEAIKKDLYAFGHFTCVLGPGGKVVRIDPKSVVFITPPEPNWQSDACHRSPDAPV